MQVAQVLGNVAQPGFKSSGSLHLEGRLPPPFQDEAPIDQVSSDNQRIRQPSQKQVFEGGVAVPDYKTGRRKSSGSGFSGLLQPAVHSSQTKQQMASNLGFEQTQSFPPLGNLQNGNSGDHPAIPSKRRMGHIAGFQRCLFPHSHQPKVEEVSPVSPARSNLPVQGSAVRPSDGSFGIHKGGEGGEVDGPVQGYKDQPVPRRLVASSALSGGLCEPNADPDGSVSAVGMVSQFAKVGTCSPTRVQLCRLSFRPLQGSSEADSGEVANPNSKNKDANEQRPLFGPRVHVSHRFVDSHRETGGFGAPSHETDSVALEESLARARGTREGDSSSQISVPSSAVVAGRKQCAQRPTSSSSTTCSAVVYRRLKRRLGRALRRPHGKRSLVGLRKPVAHKLSRAKGGPSGPQEVRATVLGPDHFDSHGQHNGCLIHQQGGGYEIRLTLCPPLETAFLVQSQTDSSKGQAHSGKAECDSRQIVQENSGYSDRMVPPAGSLRPLMCQVAHSPSGSLCNKVQSQTTQVCVPSTRSTGMESRCSHPELGEYGCLRVPSCVSFGQGGVQDPRSGSSQVGSDCSRVAQHALVLGSSQHVCSDSSLPSKRGEPADPTVQSVSPQRSPRAQPPRLAPRASSIQAQGFSNEVATRIEAPQRQSTRAIYESKWSIFVKWCESHKVDFGSPSLTQVAEFLLFLFKEKNLQPSTIDGYRTAIADKIGCDKVNFGKDENLTRLLDSFHRDKPKGLRGVPSWNLSLVLHQLTQSPFEPLRKASLKHLTFKTVFLLALGSGKRRSEIHAWVHRNIRHQEDWANVSLFPSPCFLSKNQLAKEGPSSVAPVIIPALAPTLDKSLKEDRTLCPVRALRYYLDKTKDLRSGKQLVFVSFKKNFNKDIAPATISSWIKQTILLCYQLSNEDAQQLHQVRAHDVRAFAASKAFQGGVSLDQILSACHWKSHNTFTQFYLKDVAWADADLYHLGPVVAAQHIRE